MKGRSRTGLFLLSIVSLAWLGFWRKGCVCPIGAIQNVTQAIFDKDYAAGGLVIAVFALPLVFTLFFGRSFCASVCPLGAVQELVAVRPVQVPTWIDHALGLLAYVYLGAAVLFAATGSAWIICRYDPFVGLFRLTVQRLDAGPQRRISGRGAVHRPALLPLALSLRGDPRAARRGSLGGTCGFRPSSACSAGCAKMPAPTAPSGGRRWPRRPPSARRPGGVDRRALRGADPDRRRGVLGLGDAIVAGRPASDRPACRADPAGGVRPGEDAGRDATEAFRDTGESVESLYGRADGSSEKFAWGGALFGGWVGLVFAVKLVQLSVRRRRTDYEPDRGACVSCGRCFWYCPEEHARQEFDPNPRNEPPRPSPTDGLGSPSYMTKRQRS